MYIWQLYLWSHISSSTHVGYVNVALYEYVPQPFDLNIIIVSWIFVQWEDVYVRSKKTVLWKLGSECVKGPIKTMVIVVAGS